MSRSYANLLDLTGEGPLFTKPLARKGMPRSMTVSSLVGEVKDQDNAESVTSDAPSSISQDRLIIVANALPIHAERKPDNKVKPQ